MGKEAYVHRSMADGCAELVFHYQGVFDELVGGDRLAGPQALLHAQGRSFRRFITSDVFGIFGVWLYPFAVSHALRIPATELCGTMLDLHTLFGAVGRELEDGMMTAPDNNARLRLACRFLEAQLLQRAPKDASIMSGIAQLFHSERTHTVAEWASSFHLSTRQFERKVKEHTGLSPKVLTRIIRFQKAAAQYGGSGSRSLTDIGLECGYYDQSHFIRDFAEFSGYNPSEFFSGNAEGTEYRTVA